MATLYALDPGTEQSALVRLADGGKVVGYILPNSQIFNLFAAFGSEPGRLVIEEIQSYGMAVGREVFATVFWSGRFAEAWNGPWSLLGRRDVKLTICGSAKAKDANIRQALIDRYGGKACIRKGGPLYGIKSHLWASLALAVAYQERAREQGAA